MAEATKIEWCDSTFNGWWGCTKIAPACDFCYAADLDARYGGSHWGNVPRRRTSETNWNEPRKWQRAAAAFFEKHGRRRRVFCGSMKDWADNQVPPEWRADLWALIRDCPDLDWLLLTKRPQNIAKMKPAYWDEIRGRIWLGATVEDQEHAEKNIPHLVRHDAAVRFISAEPLLGRIDLTGLTLGGGVVANALRGTRFDVFDATAGEREEPWGKIDWVIAGGESGKNARPTHPDWLRSLRKQCADAGVPFLFKQWGSWLPMEQSDPDQPPANQSLKIWDEPSFSGRAYRVSKSVAGRLLDGAEHNGFPEARHG